MSANISGNACFQHQKLFTFHSIQTVINSEFLSGYSHFVQTGNGFELWQPSKRILKQAITKITSELWRTLTPYAWSNFALTQETHYLRNKRNVFHENLEIKFNNIEIKPWGYCAKIPSVLHKTRYNNMLRVWGKTKTRFIIGENKTSEE